MGLNHSFGTSEAGGGGEASTQFGASGREDVESSRRYGFLPFIQEGEPRKKQTACARLVSRESSPNRKRRQQTARQGARDFVHEVRCTRSSEASESFIVRRDPSPPSPPRQDRPHQATLCSAVGFKMTHRTVVEGGTLAPLGLQRAKKALSPFSGSRGKA